MQVDMRVHGPVRDQVHAGISALRVQGRRIWGATRHSLPEIVTRLMVGAGDVARFARDPQTCSALDESWLCHKCDTHNDASRSVCKNCDHDCCADKRELKKELGNILFSTVRWIDDLGLDPLECLDLAIEAQEKFAKSGRPR
jgi:hypothetical protein